MVRNAVRVVGRTRPTDSFAVDHLRIQEDNKSILVHIPRRAEKAGPPGSEVINNALEDHAFKLDLILKDASQETVFDVCAADIVKSTMQGYNGTVMCYGQTGAGKTYTMMGGTDYRTRGLAPRAVKAVFDEIASQADKTFEIRVSFVEVYCERIYDLLDPTSTEDFAIQEDSKGNIFIRGIKNAVCNSEAEALAYLFEGNSNRVTAEHSMNQASSRSHCIFTVHVTSRSRVESESASLSSKLHCIDLAGSERLSKTESQGRLMKEAQFINKSLTFLEQVVMALGNQSRAHVPFRQSKLTNLLKDSLGGNSKTTMIANMWPESRHVEETLSTLKFATRMMKVQTEATVNVVLDPATHVKQLQRTIADLKAELQMQNQLMGKSHIVYEGEVGEDERFEMEKVVRSYITGAIPEIPVRSLREVKEYFKVFKAFIEGKDAEIRAAAAAGPQVVTSPSAAEKLPVMPPTTPAAKSGKPGETAVGTIDPSSGFAFGTAAPAKSLKVTSPTKTDVPSEPRERAMTPSKIHERETDSPERELPSKNDAFTDYKATEGARLACAVKDTQLQLNDKRKICADLSSRVNDIKSQIDSAAFQLEQRRQERLAQGEEEIVDDEEFELVQLAKQKKAEYRRVYDELMTVKADRDHLATALDHTRQKLLQDFELWYNSNFGSPTKQTHYMTSLKAMRTRLTGGVAGNVEEDDALDEGEKFEILELNRVMEEDPDSVAYYSAKKMLKHSLQRPQRGGASRRVK